MYGHRLPTADNEFSITKRNNNAAVIPLFVFACLMPSVSFQYFFVVYCSWKSLKSFTCTGIPNPIGKTMRKSLTVQPSIVKGAINSPIYLQRDESEEQPHIFGGYVRIALVAKSYPVSIPCGSMFVFYIKFKNNNEQRVRFHSSNDAQFHFMNLGFIV